MLCLRFVMCACFFFFFKQKTAYEMRISDWSSDVCSSDLSLRVDGRPAIPEELTVPLLGVVDPRSRIIPPRAVLPFHEVVRHRNKRLLRYEGDIGEIGRASCRDRVCQYV